MRLIDSLNALRILMLRDSIALSLFISIYASFYDLLDHALEPVEEPQFDFHDSFHLILNKELSKIYFIRKIFICW
jgi:hypothetical protein